MANKLVLVVRLLFSVEKNTRWRKQLIRSYCVFFWNFLLLLTDCVSKSWQKSNEITKKRRRRRIKWNKKNERKDTFFISVTLWVNEFRFDGNLNARLVQIGVVMLEIGPFNRFRWFLFNDWHHLKIFRHLGGLLLCLKCDSNHTITKRNQRHVIGYLFIYFFLCQRVYHWWCDLVKVACGIVTRLLLLLLLLVRFSAEIWLLFIHKGKHMQLNQINSLKTEVRKKFLSKKTKKKRPWQNDVNYLLMM